VQPYTGRSELPHHDRSTAAVTDPKTFPEMLDAAQTGEQFAALLGGAFKALEKAIDEEHDDE
jgi:hypothetical protein